MKICWCYLLAFFRLLTWEIAVNNSEIFRLSLGTQTRDENFSSEEIDTSVDFECVVPADSLDELADIQNKDPSAAKLTRIF